MQRPSLSVRLFTPTLPAKKTAKNNERSTSLQKNEDHGYNEQNVSASLVGPLLDDSSGTAPRGQSPPRAGPATSSGAMSYSFLFKYIIIGDTGASTRRPPRRGPAACRLRFRFFADVTSPRLFEATRGAGLAGDASPE